MSRGSKGFNDAYSSLGLENHSNHSNHVTAVTTVTAVTGSR
jgi:hypothetical protein